jgi:hypothetical protein
MNRYFYFIIVIIVVLCASCSSESEVDKDAEELCQCIKDSGEDWEKRCEKLGDKLEKKYKDDKKGLKAIKDKVKDCLPSE